MTEYRVWYENSNIPLKCLRSRIRFFISICSAFVFDVFTVFGYSKQTQLFVVFLNLCSFLNGEPLIHILDGLKPRTMRSELTFYLPTVTNELCSQIDHVLDDTANSSALNIVAHRSIFRIQTFLTK